MENAIQQDDITPQQWLRFLLGCLGIFLPLIAGVIFLILEGAIFNRKRFRWWLGTAFKFWAKYGAVLLLPLMGLFILAPVSPLVPAFGLVIFAFFVILLPFLAVFLYFAPKLIVDKESFLPLTRIEARIIALSVFLAPYVLLMSLAWISLVFVFRP